MTTTAPAPSSVDNAVTEDVVEDNVVASHYLVQCDECGEDPIIGIRYKSLLRRNYDVCEQCLQENHGGSAAMANKFIAFEKRVSLSDTRPLEPEQGGRSITVYSLEHLAHQLEHDPTIGDITFYAGTQTPPAACEAAKIALAKHTGMTCFHVYIRGNVEVGDNIEAIAGGLKDNQSVISVSWSIVASDTNRRLDDRAARAMQDLMETNTTIRYMFVRRPRGFFASARYDLVEDSLADYLFEGLAKAQLRTFRYVGHSPVSDAIKQKACDAMESNPSIKRIKVKFENDDCQLDILTLDKKQKWMKRWVELEETSSADRLQVLQEIQTSHLDTVPALYHLLIRSPGLFIERPVTSSC